MITWGISANSHDASLAVFDKDRLVFASHSERFSGKKNDPDLDLDLIEYARQWGEPDEVIWYETPWKKTLRQFVAGQGIKISENNIKKYLSQYGIRSPLVTTSHHHSHAAAGYYTSGFTDAVVVCIDSIGEFETLTIWQGQGDQLKRLYSQRYPHSIGLWYSAMTQRIGLKPNEEEYILMGMSALGDYLKYYPDIYRDFIGGAGIYKSKVNLHRGCLWWRPELNSEQDRFDLAAATQKIYEDLFVSVLKQARSLSKSKNLVIMGGCALNCVANTLAYKFYDQVWIMPNPGDAGSSIGAVLAHRSRHIVWPGPYLGYDLGYHLPEDDIVDRIIKEGVCAVARGPAEFGPRALGNRSLLADPRLPDIKDRVNKIKKREPFRPFAPAILAEHAHNYFDLPTRSSPYMQLAVKCLKPEDYPGIVHYDGTSRVQTVSREDNSRFRDILEVWYRKTGCPMLLNTSLNIKGEPMVNDEEDCHRWEALYGLPVLT